MTGVKLKNNRKGREISAADEKDKHRGNIIL